MELPKPTDSELEILQVLWERGPASVRDVNEVLSQRREVGYTTTLKIMQIMLEKGLLTREKDGKLHVYEAALPRETTQRVLIDRFLENAFGGSAMQLVMQTLGGHKASHDEIEQIRAYLNSLETDSNS